MSSSTLRLRHFQFNKRHLRHGLWLIPLALLVVAALSSVPVWRHPPIAASSRNVVERAMLEDLNATRRGQGLHPLAMDARLSFAAGQHADDMVTRNYFDHISPDGRTPFQRLRANNIHYVWAGENLAESDSRTEAEQALLESPEHRANILNPHYRKVGISVVKKSDGQFVFVQEFSN